MQRYAIVNGDGKVETVVESEVEAVPWPDCTVVACDDITGTGDIFDGASFTRPDPPAAPGDATVGQIVDIALQLGLIDSAKVLAILPLDPNTVVTTKDGQETVDLAVVDVLVDEALKAETVVAVDGKVDVPAMDEPVLVQEV